MDIENKKRKEYLSVAGLIFVGLVWGLGFPALKVMSEAMPTFYIIALRFFIASVLLSLFFFKRFSSINIKLLKSALILSFFLFFTYVFATVGIQYTTSAKASFFCCLGVLIIPVISRLLFKVRITGRVFFCIFLCTVGLFFISYTQGMGWHLSPGDILCLCCSVCGAFHVVFVGRLAKQQDVALLTIFQLFFISVFAAAAAFATEDFPAELAAFDLAILMFLGIFCTAAAFLIQTASQRYISPARVGVIFSIEPVSGAALSALLLGDKLGVFGVIGGLLIVVSIIIMESGS